MRITDQNMSRGLLAHHWSATTFVILTDLMATTAVADILLFVNLLTPWKL
jgi:hypothetical protein